MAFDNVLLSLQNKKADAQAKTLAAEKGKTDATAANAAVQDPALADAYMSHALVATQAKNAMDAADAADVKLNAAKAKQAEAEAAAVAARARADEAKVAADAATAGIPDQSAHDFNVDVPDTEARRVQAEQAIAKAEAARVEAENAAAKAVEAAKELEGVSKTADQAATEAKKAIRDGAQLQGVPPGKLGADTDQFNLDSKAAKDKVNGLGKDAADDAAAAAAASATAADQATKDSKALREAAASEKDYLDTRANRVNTQIGGQSKNKINDLGGKALDTADEARTKAAELADSAEQAARKLTNPPGNSPIDKAQKAVDEAEKLKNDIKPVYENALKAAQKVPYDSDANAAKAKEAIKAAEDAKKAADEAAKLASDAAKELQNAQNQLQKAKDAVAKSLDDITRAAAQERVNLRNEQSRLRQKLKDLNRDKDKLDRKTAEKERKLEEAKKAVEKAKQAAKLPDAPPGEGVCGLPGAEEQKAIKRLQEAQDAFDRWKGRQDAAAGNLGPLQERFDEIARLLTDTPRLEATLPAIGEVRRKIREEAMPAIQDMQKSLPALENEVKAIKEEAAKAKAAAEQAARAKDEAVDKRIEQLMAEGHGPQRHEGQVTPKDMGERAVYKIDPESHLQIDAETLSDPKFHEAHSADAIASKFTSKETYVLAESNAREQVLAAADPLSTDETILKPLTELGGENEVASGIKSKYDPNKQPKKETSVGPVREIPTKPPYAYDPATPPPDRSQMDEAKMAADIKSNSEKVDFSGGKSKAIYRKDANGKWFLRTMWTEPKAP